MFVYLSIHILCVFFCYYMLIIFSVIWIFFKGNKSRVIKFREESLFAGLLFLEFFTFAKKAKLSTRKIKYEWSILVLVYVKQSTSVIIY